jgi:hypothetical protein
MRARVAWSAVLVLACSVTLSGSGFAAEPAIRDDFTGSEISRQNWFVCERDENEFSLVTAPGGGFQALRTQVRPRPDLAMFALQSGHSGCANEAGEYQPGGDERAELWEADPIQLKLGTEVWYRFSMYVDPAVPKTHGRLVIGQWKQTGGLSPIIAQRFNGRVFTITTEQDNRSEDRDPRDTQCRIVIAADASAPKPVGSSNPHFKLLPGVTTTDAAPSLGHDAFEVTHGMPDGPALASTKGCVSDLKVEALAPLPSLFGRWTELRYHIKATAEGNGFLNFWADGVPIVRVTGRIGFAAGRESAEQYFKFGPYRDQGAMPVHAMIARFRRGPSEKDVE